MAYWPLAERRLEFGEALSRGEVSRVGLRNLRGLSGSVQTAMVSGVKLKAQGLACWVQAKVA